MGRVRLSHVIYGLIIVVLLVALWFSTLISSGETSVENIPAQILDTQKSILLPQNQIKQMKSGEFINTNSPVAFAFRGLIISPYPAKAYRNSFNDAFAGMNATQLKLPGSNTTFYILHSKDASLNIDIDTEIYAGKSASAPLFAYPPAFLKVSVVRVGSHVILDRELPLGTPVISSDGTLMGIVVGKEGTFAKVIPVTVIISLLPK